MNEKLSITNQLQEKANNISIAKQSTFVSTLVH